MAFLGAGALALVDAPLSLVGDVITLPATYSRMRSKQDAEARFHASSARESEERAEGMRAVEAVFEKARDQKP